MSTSIDERIPREIGKGALPDHPAIKTPWEKLISFHDAYHFACRHNAMIAASFMQVYRILIPDYEARAARLCENSQQRSFTTFSGPVGTRYRSINNAHPFMRGGFIGAINGDVGDEALLMCGRLNDFGTYRVEKELDICDWDIVGSEFCRATTNSLHGNSMGQNSHNRQPGPELEYSMVEARGCGDLHCRIVAENREKYPMPPRKIWEVFGPIATSDQIQFTPEEEMVTESQFFREECDYKFVSGTCYEREASTIYRGGGACATHPLGTDYLMPVIDEMIAKGEVDEKFVFHLIKCVFEAAGKTAFGDFYAAEGLRSWLGVPNNINDGRVLGAYVETIAQVLAIDYEVEAFNKDEVIYRFTRAGLERRMPKLTHAYISMWFGMSKTLLGAQWSLWEEAGDTAPEILRIKIGKKIDKFC